MELHAGDGAALTVLQGKKLQHVKMLLIAVRESRSEDDDGDCDEQHLTHTVVYSTQTASKQVIAFSVAHRASDVSAWADGGNCQDPATLSSGGEASSQMSCLN